jgi:ribosomal protein S18 acetylase RimI-like enzyme
MDEILVRPARSDEAEVLTGLTRRSKAYWGYPRAVLDQWADVLSVSTSEIRSGQVVVAERSGAVAGYYRITGRPPDGQLADLFLEPEAIGTGLGRTLWEHALASARRAGFDTVTLESDPHAEGFYLRMGAERVGDRRVAPGRVLPVLRITLREA